MTVAPTQEDIIKCHHVDLAVRNKWIGSAARRTVLRGGILAILGPTSEQIPTTAASASLGD